MQFPDQHARIAQDSPPRTASRPSPLPPSADPYLAKRFPTRRSLPSSSRLRLECRPNQIQSATPCASVEIPPGSPAALAKRHPAKKAPPSRRLHPHLCLLAAPPP